MTTPVSNAQFFPNARTALAFSAKRDVMLSGQAVQTPSQAPEPTATRLPDIPFYKPLNIKFGAQPLYDGPYDAAWVLTDFQDQTSNGRIDARFLKVLRFVDQARKQGRSLPGFEWSSEPRWRGGREPGVLVPKTINDVPLRNIDYAAQSLFELSREPNQDIFVHVTDPGVGSGQKAHERSILVTDHHGVHVGPNNGTLGLLTQFLDTIDEPYHLYEIDQQQVAELERLRPDAVRTAPGKTFHGRDVFGVVAAAIAGGIDPASLATLESVEKSLEPVVPPFGRNSRFPQVGESVEVLVNRDNTSGNLVLNIPVDQSTERELLSENARFVLVNPDNGAQLEAPFKQTFAQVAKGSGVSYSGSKGTPDPSAFYLEVAINSGDAGKAVELAPIEAASRLTLKRLS